MNITPSITVALVHIPMELILAKVFTKLDKANEVTSVIVRTTVVMYTITAMYLASFSPFTFTLRV